MCQTKMTCSHWLWGLCCCPIFHLSRVFLTNTSLSTSPADACRMLCAHKLKGTPSFSLEMKNCKLLILWAHVSSAEERRGFFTHLKLIIVAHSAFQSKQRRSACGWPQLVRFSFARIARKIIPAINTLLRLVSSVRRATRIHQPSAQLQSSRMP